MARRIPYGNAYGWALGLGAAIVVALAPTSGQAYAVDGSLATEPKPTTEATEKEPAVRTAFLLGLLLRAGARGAVVRGAVGAGVAGGAGAMTTRGAMAATPRAPAPYYGARPAYSRPPYQPSFRPSIHVIPRTMPNYGYASGNGYASSYAYQAPQRECWTTGYEVIPVYGGRIIRRHYRCAYR
jgi:hypothetical protein